MADFDPPLYNVWKQQEKSGGDDHYGGPTPQGVRPSPPACGNAASLGIGSLNAYRWLAGRASKKGSRRHMDVTEWGNRLKRNATTATACTENTRLTTG
jgi:hypothetical protein